MGFMVHHVYRLSCEVCWEGGTRLDVSKGVMYTADTVDKVLCSVLRNILLNWNTEFLDQAEELLYGQTALSTMQSFVSCCNTSCPSASWAPVICTASSAVPPLLHVLCYMALPFKLKINFIFVFLFSRLSLHGFIFSFHTNLS
jgi:hypothetical protein